MTPLHLPHLLHSLSFSSFPDNENTLANGGPGTRTPITATCQVNTALDGACHMVLSGFPETWLTASAEGQDATFMSSAVTATARSAVRLHPYLYNEPTPAAAAVAPVLFAKAPTHTLSAGDVISVPLSVHASHLVHTFQVQAALGDPLDFVPLALWIGAPAITNGGSATLTYFRDEAKPSKDAFTGEQPLGALRLCARASATLYQATFADPQHRAR